MLLPSERPVPPLWGFNGPSQQARGGRVGAISGQGQFEVECDQGADKSWSGGSWSTHMVGLPRGRHLLLQSAE